METNEYIFVAPTPKNDDEKRYAEQLLSLSEKVKIARVEANGEALIDITFVFWGLRPPMYAVPPKR